MSAETCDPVETHRAILLRHGGDHDEHAEPEDDEHEEQRRQLRHRGFPGRVIGQTAHVADTEDERAAGLLGRLPKSVRDPTVTLVKQLLPKIAKVRRPRDLRKLANDKALVQALGRDFLPIIDAAILTAATNALPLRSRWSTHLSASVTGAAGPVIANAAELAALLGGPETLVVSAPTAITVQVAATVWETYVEFSLIAQKLREAGITDVEEVRLALVRSLVPDANDFTKKVLLRGGERLAIRLLTRSAAEWVPIAGPVFGVVRANVDVHRAHRAAESIIRDRARR